MYLHRVMPRVFGRGLNLYAHQRVPATRMFATASSSQSSEEEFPILPENYKESTRLTGLAVVPNAREVLVTLYERTLKMVRELIPDENNPYREDVEAITKNRLRIVREEKLHSNIEQRIDAGQIEELIIQAEDELELIPEMAKEKPWEGPEGDVEIVVKRPIDPPSQEADIQHLHYIFNSFDPKNTGLVSQQQIERALELVEENEEDLVGVQTARNAERNAGDTLLTFDQFVRAVSDDPAMIASVKS